MEKNLDYLGKGENSDVFGAWIAMDSDFRPNGYESYRLHLSEYHRQVIRHFDCIPSPWVRKQQKSMRRFPFSDYHLGCCVECRLMRDQE